MKKIATCIMTLIIAFSVLGCSNDAKADEYNKACGLFVEGKYSEAKSIFETLGDYNNCVKMIKMCDEMEIERQLQGVWVFDDTIWTGFELRFENGRCSRTYGDYEGKDDYWIDFDAQLIYTCSDETDEQPVDFDVVMDEMDATVRISQIVGYRKFLKYTFNNGQLECFLFDTGDLLVRQ